MVLELLVPRPEVAVATATQLFQILEFDMSGGGGGGFELLGCLLLAFLVLAVPIVIGSLPEIVGDIWRYLEISR
jgi:hypothetical protein